jgi:hypothetical protein
VAADDDRRVGMREELRSGEEVIGGGSQRVLIGATVDVLAHQLFGRGVGHRPYRHVGGREPADVGGPLPIPVPRMCALRRADPGQRTLFGTTGGGRT